ncbi:MAG: hypothetical protein RI955_1390 [Bacteroidota bacterium]
MKKSILFIVLFIPSIFVFAQDIQQMTKAKPIELHGNLLLQGQLYSINGAPARQPWNAYLISGTPTLSIYGFQLPFTFTFSNTQRDFRQPFNQIGVSPQYKWLTLHAGYRNVSFSQFGLAGQTILGGGIELNPKKFRLGIMYGRAQKAVAEDTTKTIQQNLNSINYPTYKRMVLAAKLGVGTNSNFVDINFVKGKDDVKSLPYKPIKTEVLPSENLVVGLTHKFTMFKKHVEWNSEVAASIFTRDISVPKFDSSDFKFADKVNKITTINLSTVAYTAAESQIKFKNKYFSTGLKYRRVEPDYKSMGAYYFQTDMQQYTGNFATRLFKNKLSFNGSIGIQKDNVAKKKLATTQRNIYSTAINYNLNQHFGIDFNLSNYGTAQRAGTRSLSDTAKINQISNSITLTPHYNFTKGNLLHNFILVMGNQALNDRNKFTSTYTDMTMKYANFIYSLMNMDKKTNYNFGINYSGSKTESGEIILNGISLGAGKTLMKDKMNTDVSVSINNSSFNNASNGLVVNASANCSYVVSKHHSFRTNILWLKNQSKNIAAGNSFNEFTFMVQYNFTF